MNRKTVLILGGGIMQLPAIRSAGNMNWTTIVADGREDVPGRELCDYFEHIDLRDYDRMIQAALEYKSTTGLDGVFTAGTDFSETVSRVAEAAGLPGIPVEAAVRASNKHEMRKAFSLNNVPSPAFTAVKKGEAITSELLEEHRLFFPLVVKPVDNMGSRGIRRVDTLSDLKEAAGTALGYSRSGTVIIEEYLEGPEFSIDAIIYGGKTTICGFADRHIYYPPYFIEMGHTIPSELDEKDYLNVTETFRRGVEALGINEGAAKGDIRLCKGRVYIGEIAARLSGGYMSGWTFPYSSGINLTEAALRIAVGEEPGDLEPLMKKSAAERAFISIPGKIKQITTGNRASDSNIMEIFKIPSIGQRVRFPENNVEKCGNVIAVAENRNDAARSAETLCRNVRISLEPLDTDTEDFLFGKFQSWVPSAFVLRVNSNRKALEQMPDYRAGRSLEIALLTLPELKSEDSFEWHGRSILSDFRDVLETEYSFKGGSVFLQMADSPEQGFDGIVLGRLFYRSFLRGGRQGGRWMIESILRLLEQGHNITELLEKWKNL